MNPEGRKTCQWKLSRVIAHVRCIKILTRLRGLNPVQTKATLLDVICCIRLHNLLHVVACRFQHCWELLHRFAHHCQQLPTFLTQQCWELLRPFALSFRDKTANFSGLHCSRQRLEHKENQTKNRKMTRKPWSHVRLWNVGYLGFTTERILVLRDFITMIPPHSISEL